MFRSNTQNLHLQWDVSSVMWSTANVVGSFDHVIHDASTASGTKGRMISPECHDHSHGEFCKGVTEASERVGNYVQECLEYYNICCKNAGADGEVLSGLEECAVCSKPEDGECWFKAQSECLCRNKVKPSPWKEFHDSCEFVP